MVTRFMTNWEHRWERLATLPAAVLWLAYGFARVLNPDERDFQESVDYATSALYSAGLFAVALGFAGLRAWQRERTGRLGTVGATLAACGGVLAGAGNLVAHGFGLPAAGWWAYLPGVLLLASGWLLVGVATIRASDLPRWHSSALLLGLFGCGILGRGGGFLVGLAWLALAASLRPAQSRRA